MPLELFLDEVVALLQADPEAKEILVERVRFLRFAAENGTYEQTLVMLTGH